MDACGSDAAADSRCTLIHQYSKPSSSTDFFKVFGTYYNTQLQDSGITSPTTRYSGSLLLEAGITTYYPGYNM